MSKYAMLSDDKSTIIYTEDFDAALDNPNRYLKKEVVVTTLFQQSLCLYH